MIRKEISSKRYSLIVAVSFVFLFCFYLYLSHNQHIKNPLDTTIPTLHQLYNGVIKIYNANWLIIDSKATGYRLFAGLSTGVILSLIVGMGMGVSKSIEAFFIYPILFFARIPSTAMMAIYFTLFGTDLNLYIAMIAMGIFPALTMAIFAAAKTDVPDVGVFKAYTLGASNWEVILEVVLMQILPRIIDNIRLSIGPAMVFLIAAEWMLAGEGFGYRLRVQSRFSYMDVVYIYLFVLGVFGVCLDWCLVKLRLNLCPWFERSE